MTAVIVDTGPLVAAANPKDPLYEQVRTVLLEPSFDLVIPILCIAEVAYLVGSRQGAAVEARVVSNLRRLPIEAPTQRDWDRILELAAQYADWPLGTVDASVVALAERLETDVVVTLDRRHFGAIRPRHCDAFRLMP